MALSAQSTFLNPDIRFKGKPMEGFVLEFFNDEIGLTEMIDVFTRKEVLDQWAPKPQDKTPKKKQMNGFLAKFLSLRNVPSHLKWPYYPEDSKPYNQVDQAGSLDRKTEKKPVNGFLAKFLALRNVPSHLKWPYYPEDPKPYNLAQPINGFSEPDLLDGEPVNVPTSHSPTYSAQYDLFELCGVCPDGRERIDKPNLETIYKAWFRDTEFKKNQDQPVWQEGWLIMF